MDLNEAGIEGRLFDLNQNFLKLNLNEMLPDAIVQPEGKPQGSVVSP